MKYKQKQIERQTNRKRTEERVNEKIVGSVLIRLVIGTDAPNETKFSIDRRTKIDGNRPHERGNMEHTMKTIETKDKDNDRTINWESKHAGNRKGVESHTERIAK